MAGAPTLVSHPARLDHHAARHPDAVAVTVVAPDAAEVTVTWAGLARRTRQVAGLLAGRGAGPGTFVVAGLANGVDHVVLALAAWRVGACVLPVSPRLPGAELSQLLDVVREHAPTLAVLEPDSPAGVGDLSLDALGDEALPEVERPDVLPTPGVAIASGGSTGRPKVVLNALPFGGTPDTVPGLAGRLGLRPGQVQLVSGPLYHTGPFGYLHLGLFYGHHVVLLERFGAALALQQVERHAVQFAFQVPTMLARELRHLEALEAGGRPTPVLDSLEILWSAAAPCPPWVLRGWIDRLGPGRVAEAYGSSEGVGGSLVWGDEWLARPGTVGRPLDCEVRILGGDGREVPVGEVGEVYLRPTVGDGPTFSYLGAPPAPRTPEGFTSIGDLGRMDQDGYLYLADRRHDLIICGGANVYPAEVEAALSEHPEVADVAVVGVPHHDLGRTVHAMVEPVPGRAPAVGDLAAHCRERLAPYKVPRTFELVAALPRTEAGKIRRSALEPSTS